MVAITKEESFRIREKFPNVYIVIVNKKGSARKKNRFVEESRSVINYLNKLRTKKSRREVYYGKK